jgi:hypothetical protein
MTRTPPGNSFESRYRVSAELAPNPGAPSSMSGSMRCFELRFGHLDGRLDRHDRTRCVMDDVSEPVIPALRASDLGAFHEYNPLIRRRGRERVHNLAEIRSSRRAPRGEEAIRSVLRIVPAAKRSQAQRSLEPILAQTRELRDLELRRLRSAGAKSSEKRIDREAEKIIVKRKRIGTIPMDDLPQDQWEGYPSGAWDKTVIAALYWCDGKRNLSQVIHLTNMEVGVSHFDFVGYFRFLRRHGYVEFAK